MIVHRVAEPALAQVGYLVGCEVTRQALAVDPTRDIAPFLEAADALDLRIVGVTETHVHADFISGARALAAVTGGTLYLSGEGPTDGRYTYDTVDGTRRVAWLYDGHTIPLGTVAVRAMHTPGHTPEHLTFAVGPLGDGGHESDGRREYRSDMGGIVPEALLTGDFIFVGDVGRPDLLEKAVGVAGSAGEGARQLFHSLEKLAGLPGSIAIWPGHGAGSACGKNLGKEPSTTLERERQFNWAFQALRTGEAALVTEVLQGQPTPPAYFARMKQVNRDGPPFTQWRAPETRTVASPPTRPLLDVRHADAFAAGHARGAINVPLNGSFATWAGALLAPDQSMVLGVPDDCDNCAAEATRRLALIGLESVVGEILRIDAAAAWRETLAQITVSELAGLDGHVILDVRNDGEWAEGHIPHAHHIPLAALPARLAELRRDEGIVVHCQGGARSAIAASYLLANGFGDVANLAGGFAAWQASAQRSRR